MTIEMTEAGAEARSIMRWAWQDPEARARQALGRVNALGEAAIDPQAQAEITDAASMLSRLVGTLTSGNAISGPTLSAHLSRPMSMSESLELAAIHGHHIKGTQYTFRHGWIPLIGEQFNDRYPGWLHRKWHEEREAKAKAARTAAGAAPKRSDILAPSPRKATSPARTKRATLVPTPLAHAAPAKPQHQKYAERAAAGKKRLAEQQANPKIPFPQPIAEVPHAAAASPDDHALAALAAPGAQMAALKAYIDARVSAEVARQMGQISAKQEHDLKTGLARMHRSQQRLITKMREGIKEGDEADARTDRIQLSMYTLFNAGSVAAALGGIAAGLSPIGAALVAGIVPMINVIHDYVRRSG